MHRSETRELVECAVCRAEIHPSMDRAYAVTSRTALCFDCALLRGGRYDEERGVWSRLPRADDLRTGE